MPQRITDRTHLKTLLPLLRVPQPGARHTRLHFFLAHLERDAPSFLRKPLRYWLALRYADLQRLPRVLPHPPTTRLEREAQAFRCVGKVMLAELQQCLAGLVGMEYRRVARRKGEHE